jgi:hypothetical protein
VYTFREEGVVADTSGGKPRRPFHSLGEGRRSKKWAQDAIENIEILHARAEFIRARHDERAGSRGRFTQARHRVIEGDIPGAVELLDRVEDLLGKAQAAADGRTPRYIPLIGAWSGTCVDAAFGHSHNAEAALAYLYEPAEMRAAIPEAVRRARTALAPDDPVMQVCQDLMDFRACTKPDQLETVERRRKDLSSLIEEGHSAADRHRSRLRTFRNIVLIGILVTTVLVGGVVWMGTLSPNIVPLCFIQDPAPPEPDNNFACPTKQGRDPNAVTLGAGKLASGGDAGAVALMGLLGGALSAAFFIRGLYANSTSYNVLVPLALTKLPAGALTAIVGLLFVAGDFIPGFTAIDKQSQILAYAVAFGFAQQLFTQLLDRRARDLTANIPTKAKDIDAEPPKSKES